MVIFKYFNLSKLQLGRINKKGIADCTYSSHKRSNKYTIVIPNIGLFHFWNKKFYFSNSVYKTRG